MAILKTHFFNISFEQKDLMKMLIKMTEYQDVIFPQDSKKIAHNVKGVSVMDEVNPYNEPLDNMYHTLNRLNLDAHVQNNEFSEINLFNTNKLIDEVNSKIDNIIEVREGIIKEKEENDEAIVLLNNLKDSKISIDDIQNTKYITCRFGKIPEVEFNKIQYYRDYEFIFQELSRSNQYVWIVYAGLTSSISQIDNAFSSMSFEQINIPEFAHGKITEAISELHEETKAMEKYIKKMDSKVEDVKNSYCNELLDTFTKLYNLKRLYDKCRYVVDFSQKAAIYAFSSLDLKEVETRFSDIASVRIIELPVNIYENKNIIAPVLVKNNALFQPFENILSTTIGDTFDPTAFVAIISMLVGAICIGDIGVGIVLIVLGLLVTIRKTNNFGKILKRLGTAILIGGLFYGTLFYRIELYRTVLTLPLHVVHTFLFGVSVWVIAIVVLIIIKKILRKSIEI